MPQEANLNGRRGKEPLPQCGGGSLYTKALEDTRVSERDARRYGQLLKQLARVAPKQRNSAGRKGKELGPRGGPNSSYAQALSETGVSKQAASRYQALADVPQQVFDEASATHRHTVAVTPQAASRQKAAGRILPDSGRPTTAAGPLHAPARAWRAWDGRFARRYLAIGRQIGRPAAISHAGRATPYRQARGTTAGSAHAQRHAWQGTDGDCMRGNAACFGRLSAISHAGSSRDARR